MKNDFKRLKNKQSLITFGMGIAAVGIVSAAIAVPLVNMKRNQIDREENNKATKHNVEIGTKTFLSIKLSDVAKDIQVKFPLAKEGKLHEVDQDKEDISFVFDIKDISSDLQELEDAINGVDSSADQEDESSALKGKVTLTFDKFDGHLEQVIAKLGQRDTLLLEIKDQKISISFNGVSLKGKPFDVALKLLAPIALGNNLPEFLDSDVISDALKDKREFVEATQDNSLVDWTLIKDKATLLVLGKDKPTLEVPKTNTDLKALECFLVDKDKIIPSGIDPSLIDKTKVKLIDQGAPWSIADPSKVIKVPVYKEVHSFAYGSKQYKTKELAQQALSKDVHKLQVYVVNGKEFTSKELAIKEWLTLDNQVSSITGESYISKVSNTYNGMPLSNLMKLDQGIEGYLYGDKVYPSEDLAKAVWLKEWSIKKKQAIQGSLKVTCSYGSASGTIVIPYEAKVDGAIPTQMSLNSEAPFKWDAGTKISADGRKEYILSWKDKEILRYTPQVGKDIHSFIDNGNIDINVLTKASLETPYTLKDAPVIIHKRYTTKANPKGSSDLVELKKENLIPGFVYDSKFYLDKPSALDALSKSFKVPLSDSSHKILVGSSTKIYQGLTQAYANCIQEVTSRVQVSDEEAKGIY